MKLRILHYVFGFYVNHEPILLVDWGFCRIQDRYLVDGLVCNLCLIISLWVYNLIFCHHIFCGLKTWFNGLGICELCVSYCSTVDCTRGLLVLLEGRQGWRVTLWSACHCIFLLLHWLGSSSRWAAGHPYIFMSCCDKEESHSLLFCFGEPRIKHRNRRAQKSWRSSQHSRDDTGQALISLSPSALPSMRIPKCPPFRMSITLPAAGLALAGLPQALLCARIVSGPWKG